MSFVVDASIALAWLLDEGNDYANRVMDRLPRTRAIAPALWPTEVANGLLMAERRKRIVADDAAHLLQLFNGLAVDIADDQPPLMDIFATAKRLRLTVYDASYLSLAQHLKLPLASLDQQLLAAAAASGVSLFTAAESG